LCSCARSDGRSSAFAHAPFEVGEVLVQLVQNESEREDAFDRVDRQIARQPIAADRAEFGGKSGESRFDGAADRCAQ